MDDFDDWSVVDDCKPEPVSLLQAVPKNKTKPLPAPEYRFAVDRPRSSWQNRSESRNFIGCPAPNLGHYDSHVQAPAMLTSQSTSDPFQTRKTSGAEVPKLRRI